MGKGMTQEGPDTVMRKEMDDCILNISQIMTSIHLKAHLLVTETIKNPADNSRFPEKLYEDYLFRVCY